MSIENGDHLAARMSRAEGDRAGNDDDRYQSDASFVGRSDDDDGGDVDNGMEGSCNGDEQSQPDKWPTIDVREVFAASNNPDGSCVSREAAEVMQEQADRLVGGLRDLPLSDAALASFLTLVEHAFLVLAKRKMQGAGEVEDSRLPQTTIGEQDATKPRAESKHNEALLETASAAKRCSGRPRLSKQHHVHQGISNPGKGDVAAPLVSLDEAALSQSLRSAFREIIEKHAESTPVHVIKKAFHLVSVDLFQHRYLYARLLQTSRDYDVQTASQVVAAPLTFTPLSYAKQETLAQQAELAAKEKQRKTSPKKDKGRSAAGSKKQKK